MSEIIYGSTVEASEATITQVKVKTYHCTECDTEIPEARYKLTRSLICVDCMREFEKEGKGTVRHTMNLVVHSKNGEDVDEVETYIVRGK